MASHQKKNVNAVPIKKILSNQDIQEKKDVLSLTPKADNADRKKAVMKQLLDNLLSYTAKDSKTKNSFGKLHFHNSNSYFGWLNANGFNGFGTYIFESGESFKGTFQGSISKGLGRFTYTNGDIYEGEFLAGRAAGYGKYKTQNFKYDGFFQNGRFHGKGIWKTITEQLEGLFHNGKIKHGEARDASGVFKGTFDESGLRKHGKFTFKNGNTYNGFFVDNTFSGLGEYNWIDEGCGSTKTETKYIGYWRNGKRHGLGMLTFNQRSIICEWAWNKKSGAGIIIACNGICYCGTELFADNQYIGSNCITNCPESRQILLEAINTTISCSKFKIMENRSKNFVNSVNRLLEQYAEYFSPINPIHIPNYEIPKLPTASQSSTLELRHLQQVLIENYTNFKRLYEKYTHPADECLNHLGLNLFYLDVFHTIRDINISTILKAGYSKTSNSSIYSDCHSSGNPLAVVSFYQFFQHFVHITEVLMENEELKSKAEELRPSFFGSLAIKVLLVLRILETNAAVLFLVKDGIQFNRPECLQLLHLIEDMSSGTDKSIRSAYRVLKNKTVVEGGDEFIQTVERFYDVNFNVILQNTQIELTDLERMEIILRTCQFKLQKNLLKK